MTTLEEALEVIPDDPDTIALFLRANSIKGLRASACSCPVANYLAKATQRLVNVGSHTCGFNGGTSRLPLPVAVRAFINAFDHYGRYPELSEW